MEGPPSDMIEVDGSFGEGGGQILRTSLGLAAVLGTDVRVTKIRAGRPKPGLMMQHLTGVKALVALSDAQVEGAEFGSQTLIFRPGNPRSGSFTFDVGTAGSITLVLQAVMPILAFAPNTVSLEITGGTDVKWSPPIDYLPLVELPILEEHGYQAELELVRRGHYPRGGGLVRFETEPTAGLNQFIGLEPGRVSRIVGVSHATGLPRHVAERQAASAKNTLTKHGYADADIRVESSGSTATVGVGTGIVVAATTALGSKLGGDSIGERGVPAEKVGETAASRLVEDLATGKFLDRHMADIIVPYMALAEGLSEMTVSQITMHVLTNVRVAEWVGGVKFELRGELGQPGLLRVNGLAFHA